MNHSTHDHNLDIVPLRAAYLAGELNPENIRLQAAVSPPEAGDILDIQSLSAAEQADLRALGQAAVAAGEVAALVLAGGMATRFAYPEPKGLFPIVGEVTFLELKVRSLCSQGIPLLIMTSFHTHQPILDALEAHDYFGYRGQVQLFQQYRLPRLLPDGEVKLKDGAPDYATAGHGDFVTALQQHGLLERFMQEGGKYLLFSNIDNLGATFEPLILGLHMQRAVQMTIEVAAKAPGDKGGAPARVADRLQIVEEFLFPADFDQDRIQVFNTATYVFSASALLQPADLPWYVVRKTVEGEAVLQFEHLAGDLSAQLEILCLQIDRDERFLPVKTQQDVETVLPLIRRKYGHLLPG